MTKLTNFGAWKHPKSNTHASYGNAKKRIFWWFFKILHAWL